MKVLLDTNILVDLVQRREPNVAESTALLRACGKNGIEMVIAWHTISNIWYISRKSSGREWSLKALPLLLKNVTVPRGGTPEIRRAIEFGFSDFEDAMQAAIAEFAKVDYIATRNVGDFATSPVAAMTPSDLLALI